MNVERVLRGMAGFFVILSVLLAAIYTKWILIFTGFVGLNLVQSAFTNWCPAIWFLQIFGMKTCRQQIDALKKNAPAS
ncbi:DUF2892 domain-containing protein [Acidobacteriota bacterium]